ncbi:MULTISPECIES: cysteine desulfurase family protein [Exiguobacterium]|uniref:Cysteine desulfurase family protein n=1 Tax=Exiguobacterium antarcticum TaxID=132920 RepID=A0ABT6R124_9BACL|nr:MULTISPECIES: cysteine desulfurase family protein [Exiguobacterium]MCT4778738.1 cysteine desulfurase [Exiguobacterium soli]MDI3234513.1 cysteine desulfurase family protein [Exiguobacterium antarcticum]
MIYLDHAATTAMHPDALQQYRQAAERAYGNSSSLHDAGDAALQLLDQARTQLMTWLQLTEGTIIFTGSGSEANYIALSHLLRQSKKTTVLTLMSEHDSVTLPLKRLATKTVTISLQATGEFDWVQFKEACTEEVGVVSIQHVNSETGFIFPIADIAAFCRQRGLLFHCDGIQGFLKQPVHLTDVDAYTISSHKVYGPKGLGAVYLRRPLFSPYYEAHHEYGIRPGTVDVPGIAAFLMACSRYREENQQIQTSSKRFRGMLKKRLPSSQYQIIESPQQLDSICAIHTKQRDGQFVLLALNRAGIAVSAGSACRAGENGPNATLRAIGFDDTAAHGLIRLSFGRMTTDEEVKRCIDVLCSLEDSD